MIINDGRTDFDGKNFGCGFNFIFKNLDYLNEIKLSNFDCSESS